MNDQITTSLHTGLLIAILGVLTWASGLPALFPSLGPSAFVLAMFPESEASNPKRVIGSHVLGVIAGFLAYHLFAQGIVVTGQIPPFSTVSLRLAVSSVVAIVLTVVAMLYFGIRHPPACATTLIVALGLLPTLFDSIIIIGAVVIIVGVQKLLLRIDQLIRDITHWSPS